MRRTDGPYVARPQHARETRAGRRIHRAREPVGSPPATSVIENRHGKRRQPRAGAGGVVLRDEPTLAPVTNQGRRAPELHRFFADLPVGFATSVNLRAHVCWGQLLAAEARRVSRLLISAL